MSEISVQRFSHGVEITGLVSDDEQEYTGQRSTLVLDWGDVRALALVLNKELRELSEQGEP